MKRLCTALIALLWFGVAHAQVGGLSFPGPGIPQAAASYTGPGDIVSAANDWYGLRAYNASYASSLGNVADIVDTATGAASCTIKAKANGDADLTSNLCVGNTVSVTTFCTVTHATGCSIAKLYDQSGHSVDVTQATLATMPTLVLNAIGSLPGIGLNGAQKLQSGATGATSAQPWTVSLSAKVNTSTTGYFWSTVSGPSFGPGFTNQIDLQAGIDTVVADTFGTFKCYQGVANGASSTIKIDAGAPSTVNAGTNALTNTVVIGVDNFANFLTGTILEVGTWPSGISSGNQTSLNTNAHTYWGF